MHIRFRRHRLHPAEGEVVKPASGISLALIVGAIALLIAAAVFVPELGVLATVAQLLVALTVVVFAVYSGVRTRHRVACAEAAVQEAARKDLFWSPQSIRGRVEALFEPYWRAVQKRDVGALSSELSPRWRARLDEAFTIWRERGFKPVLFDLSLQEVKIIEAEDHDDSRSDRFVALVACRTSYHVTDTLNGDVVEGLPDSRFEKQAWHFIRVDEQWLLDRVERLGTSAGGGDIDLLSDGSFDCAS